MYFFKSHISCMQSPQRSVVLKQKHMMYMAASLVGVTPVLCLSLVLALDFGKLASPIFPPTFALLTLLSSIQP